MKRSIVVATLLSVSMQAEGLETAFKNATYDGYLRAAYQHQDEGEFAIGGKLHMETAQINGISVGTSFYTTHGLSDKYNDGISFFSSEQKAYSILGEAYIKAHFGSTEIKIGRQELDTPYADTDDIGMVPNSFEALSVVNSAFDDTTIVLAHLQKMAGVDAETPERFTKINGDDGVQVVGVSYEGYENLRLDGWYYNATDFAKMSYIEADYERPLSAFTLGIGGQYTYQDFDEGSTVGVYGLNVRLGLEEQGIIFYTAYNKANSKDGQVADNFFGGGPFFINCEHMTMAEVGENGKAFRHGIELDGAPYGLDGFGMNLSYFTAEGDGGEDLEEIDLMASYMVSDALSVDLIYSDTTDNQDERASFTNTRLFVNYSF
ncbi:MAG: OprD family outer membrane porin [Epsilonproteobacteria bacterium]|nr:OprD family outer membrane porin [Campylobacterota bacterium]